MATAHPIPDTRSSSAPPGNGLLVTVAEMPAEQLESVFRSLTSTFPTEELIVAAPNQTGAADYPTLRILPTQATNAIWPLTATDFVNAHQLAVEHKARAILMLGPGANSLSSAALHNLANAALGTQTDLAVPHYKLAANAGLVNSAILYPLSRALFGSRVRYPLAIDLGVSLRMAERLAHAGHRFTALNQGDSILWPGDEALVAGYTVDEIDVGSRMLPQPAEPNLNAILALVTGSLFSEIEAKAAFWQRPRRLPTTSGPVTKMLPVEGTVDAAPMVEAFRLAYTNLQEIWSLVLTPNSLLGLKRLSAVEPAAFRVPENLWARIVFDFLIAYKLRTINRGHLLGAMIPLYLAWVAGHVNVTASGTDAELHIEAVAAAFEADKPYVVSRWRWPDRFNS